MDAIETPAVLVDIDRLQQNIDHIQAKADRHHVSVRPHVKTHKCLEIAERQLAAGAVGITTAKIDEALVFIEQGIRSVTVAYPIVVDSKLARLIEATSSKQVELRMIVDSETVVNVLSRVAAKYGVQLVVFIKTDVGLHRCGINPEHSLLIDLAQAIEKDNHLILSGLLSHAGHSYAARTAIEARQIALEERDAMLYAQGRLAKAGFPVSEISVGATPTVVAGDNFEGITEIRPGNYVFFDQTALRMGLIGPEAVALTVLTTIVSINDEYLIVDAGSKVLSSDSGAHGSGGNAGYGIAYPADRLQDSDAALTIQKLSEEHGWINRGNVNLSIGSRVRIIPNHSCAVVNLATQLVITQSGNPIDEWPVAARGCVR